MWDWKGIKRGAKSYLLFMAFQRDVKINIFA